VGRPLQLSVGDRSGSLLLVAITGRDRRQNLVLKCLCEECGNHTEINNVAFRVRKRCKSCSQVHGAQKRTTHGAAKRGKRDKLYAAYKAMLTRCYNPNARAYRWYGAKGIKVCAEWHEFDAFRRWAMANGYQDGMTLDRSREHEDYSPDNCEYVTQSENSRRMRSKYHFVPKSAVFYNEPTFGDF
jgi:hypothetical protein